MGIIITRATSADAAEYLEYLKQIGGETDNLTFGAEGLPFTIEAESAYLAQLEFSNDDIMMVAKEHGKIIGDASLHRQPRRMSHRGDFGISVVKEHWNRGIGGRLMEKIIDFARKNGFDVIDLQVRSDNPSAIHLYKKYGFEKIGTHPAFFKIENDEISFDYMCLRV